MTLKKINPEDLVVGREYYVKMKLYKTDDSSVPFCYKDAEGDQVWLPKDQPIFTHEPSTDTELEMLVNVASRIYIDPIFDDGFDEAAKCALDLITACKNALKEVNHD